MKLRGLSSGADREGDDVDPVGDRLVKRLEGVGAHASLFPADLVGDDTRARCHADFCAFAVVVQAGVGYGKSGCCGGGVGAVAIGVQR